MNLDRVQLIDISMPITEDMPVYGGKEWKRPSIAVDADFSTGKAYESSIKMNMHTGTHLDRTAHMIPGGNTVDTLDPREMITICRVLDLTNVTERITEEDLKCKDIHEGDFILCKTRNSYEPILEGEFVFLEQSGARYLAEHKIKGVGIDALGVERTQPGHETHLTLMKIGAHILEGLRLAEVEEGEYLLIALPLNIVGAEAAPVRAVLLRQ